MLITIDTRFTRLFGPICKSTEAISGLINAGHEVRVIISSEEGFNAVGDNKEFTWVSSHPLSYFFDLIKPTFGNSLQVQVRKPMTPIQKFIGVLRGFFDRRYLIHYDYTWGSLSEEIYLDFLNRLRGEVKNSNNKLQGLGLRLALLYISLKPWVRKVIKFAPFEYSVSPNFDVPEAAEAFEKKYRYRVLISATWDDRLAFEPMPDRKRGVDYDEDEFQKMCNFVRGLDKRWGEEVGYILASKKAVDWMEMLPKDRVLDLRNFEELGLSLGQSIYLSTKIANLTVSWPSTYCIWATGQVNCLHLVFGSDRDLVVSNAINAYVSPDFDTAVLDIEKRLK